MMNDVAPLPGYPDPYGLLCAILQDATNEWRGEVWGQDGPNATTWRPRAGGPTIGGIVYHMIHAEIFWFEIIALGRELSQEDVEILKWGEMDVDQGIWPETPHEPLEWYFNLQDRYRARTLEAVKDWPSAETMVDVHGSPRSMRWILGHVIQHESYHGGQIVMLYDRWKHRTEA